MSGMETIKGKFQGLIDVLMPWEDVEVEEHQEVADKKSQQQVAAKPARAAAQEELTDMDLLKKYPMSKLMEILLKKAD